METEVQGRGRGRQKWRWMSYTRKELIGKASQRMKCIMRISGSGIYLKVPVVSLWPASVDNSSSGRKAA